MDALASLKIVAEKQTVIGFYTFASSVPELRVPGNEPEAKSLLSSSISWQMSIVGNSISTEKSMILGGFCPFNGFLARVKICHRRHVLTPILT